MRSWTENHLEADGESAPAMFAALMTKRSPLDLTAVAEPRTDTPAGRERAWGTPMNAMVSGVETWDSGGEARFTTAGHLFPRLVEKLARRFNCKVVLTWCTPADKLAGRVEAEGKRLKAAGNSWPSELYESCARQCRCLDNYEQATGLLDQKEGAA